MANEKYSKSQFNLNLPDEIDLRTLGDVAYLLAKHYEQGKQPRDGDYFRWLISSGLPFEYVEIAFKKPIPRETFLEAMQEAVSQFIDD